MKWIYIMFLLVVAGFISGCIDRDEIGSQANVSPGEKSMTAAAGTPPATPQSSLGSEELSVIESELAAMDMTVNDTNMEISLLDTI